MLKNPRLFFSVFLLAMAVAAFPAYPSSLQEKKQSEEDDERLDKPLDETLDEPRTVGKPQVSRGVQGVAGDRRD